MIGPERSRMFVDPRSYSTSTLRFGGCRIYYEMKYLYEIYSHDYLMKFKYFQGSLGTLGCQQKSWPQNRNCHCNSEENDSIFKLLIFKNFNLCENCVGFVDTLMILCHE